MAQNPWDNDPVVRSRAADPTLDQVIDVSRISEQEAANLRVGQRIRLKDGRETVVAGTPTQAAGGTAQSAAVTTKEMPWESDPVVEAPVTSSVANAERVAAERIAAGSGLSSGGGAVVQGMTAQFGDELGGLVAGGGQLVGNAIRRATGQPIEINSADMRSAMTQGLRNEGQRFASEQPLANIGAQAAGGLLTGGLGLGRGVVGAVATGAAYGATGGAGAGTGYAERLPGAGVGAVVGGIGGGVIQGGMSAAAPYVSPVVQRLTSIVNPGGASRSATRNYGPAVGAATRLADRIGPEQYAERARLQSLGLNPSVLDTFDNAGERLIRSAAGPAGPGADMAIQNSVARTANLKPEIMGVTRGLSNDPRSASAVREGLGETRDALATTQYREPYAAQVRLTPEAIQSIRGPNGNAAIREAIEDELSSPNFDASVVAELENMMVADLDQLPTVSGRALDRVRIALRDTSEGFMRGERPNRTRARGFAARVEGVDTALDAAPGLTEARDTYRNLSGAMEAIDEADAIFSTDPQDFAVRVQGMTDEQREATIIGVRQSILDALGKQRNAGTGSLQNIAEAPYTRQNLEALLGADEAAQYIGRIQEGVRQAQRAARISPNTNSQTFGRSLDEETMGVAQGLGIAADVGQAATGNPFAAGRLADRLIKGVTLSPEERAAIVQLGIGSADDLERIVAVAERARQAGRPPPREVRAYILRTRNVLGAQSPVALDLERLLLPSPVSAEEEPR